MPKAMCSQCGQTFAAPACGPTHAQIAAMRELRRVLQEWRDAVFCAENANRRVKTAGEALYTELVNLLKEGIE